MASLIEQGTQEGLRLLDQEARGLDLTAPTPPLPEFPEDETLLGFHRVQPEARAKIKLARERQNMDKLDRMFKISDVAIKTAQTLDEERRKKYLNKMIPSIERVYPGAGKSIRLFSEDKSGYQNLLRKINDPKERAIFEGYGRAGQFDEAMKYASELSLTKGRKKTTTPSVTSPTKQERGQVNRFIERNWPKDIPELDDQQEDFVDILGSKAKEISRKKKINLDDALNEAWPQVYKENVLEGKKTGWFDLELDKDSALKARQEVQRIVEEYTQDNPAAPTTEEEFKKLPPGSWFINPATGKVLRKKGGK